MSNVDPARFHATAPAGRRDMRCATCGHPPESHDAGRGQCYKCDASSRCVCWVQRDAREQRGFGGEAPTVAQLREDLIMLFAYCDGPLALYGPGFGRLMGAIKELEGWRVR